MARVRAWVCLTFVCLAAVVLGCTVGDEVETAVPLPATLTPTTPPIDTPTSSGDMGSCPITPIPDTPFVPPDPYPAAAPDGHFWYGTNELWTDLPVDDVWYGLPQSEAGYGNKIALWHEGYSQTEEPQPAITLSAQQLDGAAVMAPVVAGTNAYHPDYGQFMMTGIELPTLGCWEITAEYKGAALTFVVWVIP